MTESPAVEAVTGPDCAIGESPVWRAAESALYWVDISGRCIHRLQVESGHRRSWPTGEMVACIAFDAKGGLIAGMETGIFSLTLAADGSVAAKCRAAPEFPMAGMRFNDGRCDRQGRFWAGTMHMNIPAANAAGELFRYTAGEGLSVPIVRGLLVQNGLAWSPEGDRMYLSDSHTTVRLIWAFDYDRETGTPRNRRAFVDMNSHAGRPDGAAVDADGCYWSCAADAGVVMRFTPEGKLDRSIAFPVRKPTMCAFGGSGLDTMFVTSIRPPAEADLAGQPLAGAVFAVRPGVRGLPEPEFGHPG
jgi:sugar lactone lactonase YvrE